MTARVRANPSLLWALCMLASGCAGIAVRQPEVGLALGLFEVVARRCENPLELEGYPCEWTNYIELLRDPEIAPDAVVLVQWLAGPEAGDEYTYAASDLRGYFVDARNYLVHDGTLGTATLGVEGRELREYRHARYRGSHEGTPPHELAHAHDVVASMQLTLKRVARTPALDQLLPYPGPDWPRVQR